MINDIQDEIIEEFTSFDDWMDRYSLLIDYGNGLEPFPQEDKTDQNLIEGCQSKVWFTAEMQDGRVVYRGDSDAILVKGIVALSGEWNCQLRHGMEYFYDAKILHFLGEKQHCELGAKEYLQRVKKEGFSEYVMDRIKKPKRFLLSPAGLLCGDDLYFNYTDEYEQHKKHFFHPKAKKEQLIDSISAYKNETKGIKRLLLRLNFYILRHLLC